MIDTDEQVKDKTENPEAEDTKEDLDNLKSDVFDDVAKLYTIKALKSYRNNNSNKEPDASLLTTKIDSKWEIGKALSSFMWIKTQIDQVKWFFENFKFNRDKTDDKNTDAVSVEDIYDNDKSPIKWILKDTIKSYLIQGWMLWIWTIRLNLIDNNLSTSIQQDLSDLKSKINESPDDTERLVNNKIDELETELGSKKEEKEEKKEDEISKKTAEAKFVEAGLIVSKDKDMVSPLPKEKLKKTSDFGVDRWNHKHGWIDYGADKWTKIYSMVPWTVEKIDYQRKWFGNYVIIKDDEWREIIYAHLEEEPNLNKWDDIALWQEIAKVWNTWKSTWPHLHLEVREKWKPINPLDVFPEVLQAA